MTAPARNVAAPCREFGAWQEQVATMRASAERDRRKLKIAIERTYGHREVYSAHQVITSRRARYATGSVLDTLHDETLSLLAVKTRDRMVIARRSWWWVAGRDSSPAVLDVEDGSPRYVGRGWVRLDPDDARALLANPRRWLTRFWPWDEGMMMCQVEALTLPTPNLGGWWA